MAVGTFCQECCRGVYAGRVAHGGLPSALRSIAPMRHGVSTRSTLSPGPRMRLAKCAVKPLAEAHQLAKADPKRGKGRLAKGAEANAEKVKANGLKNTRYALLKTRRTVLMHKNTAGVPDEG